MAGCGAGWRSATWRTCWRSAASSRWCRGCFALSAPTSWPPGSRWAPGGTSAPAGAPRANAATPGPGWRSARCGSPREPGRGHWLLLRRSLDDGALAYYVCYGPARTSLAELVRVAGLRWTVECGFQQAKGEAGLDHYEVRRYDAWYRHVTLSMLAQAFLAVVRARAAAAGMGGG
jgi:hypothetical protein